MKIKKIGEPEVVMSNPSGKHNYFGWPSVARLQNGKIAVTASGYRLAHVCPFGKAVISYSEDEGKSYTPPAPVIDTPLDDRDGGILAYGKSNVIVTSFNNTVEFQRKSCGYSLECVGRRSAVGYAEKYLDTVTPEEEQKYLGSEFRISRDCGVSFGEIHKCPVTSPHGPCVLKDGTVLWVGRVFSADDSFGEDSAIKAYKINPDGSTEYVGAVPQITEDGSRLDSCEPHATELPNGKIICQLRVQGHNYFSIYQTESCDSGKSWSLPHRIIGKTDGAPPHLLLHSSGVLISAYGCRKEPFGIKAMLSLDGGETWDINHDICDCISWDLGYPSTVELNDGSLLTVYYAHTSADSPAVILQQKWKLEI